MLDDIKDTDGGHAAVFEAGRLCGRADNILESTRLGIPGTGGPGLDQHHLPSGIHQPLGHIAVSAPDIENRAFVARRKPPNQLDKSGITMLEPKRFVLNLEALVVAFAWIRNRFFLCGSPNAIGPASQTGRQL
jgi:hypothetical protein